MTTPFADHTIRELAVQLRAHTISVPELVAESLAEIDAHRGLHAFISTFDEDAREVASASQVLLERGYDLGPLHGMPIAVKDNIDMTQGVTTYGSKIFSAHRASADAPVVKNLKAAGGIAVGKTNLHEFAWGGTTANPHYGVACNPWNPAHNPAGSSGGSGIAVALRMVCTALGTDTGGSIRLPSAMDGVCGIRPTLGTVPTEGIFPVAWSMDTVGPLCTNAEDTELVFQIMRGDTELRMAPAADLTRLRIGIVRGYSLEGLQEDVRRATEDALALLREQGARIVEVDLRGVEDAVSAQLVVDAVEPSAVHHVLLDAHPDDYGRDVYARLAGGRELSGVEYVQAQRFREFFRGEMRAAFTEVDVLVSPTLPFTAPRIGQEVIEIAPGVPVSHLSGNMKFTALASMSGTPAMSIPIGFDRGGLPIGMQIIAPWSREDIAFSVAKAYQGITDVHRRHPEGMLNASGSSAAATAS